MAAFLLRRSAAAALLLWLLATLTFALFHLAPGEPIAALAVDNRLSAEDRAAISRRYGLDRPFLVQYGHWLGNALRGDWGRSFSDRRPTAAVIGEALANTAILAGGTVVLLYSLALPGGILAAVRRGAWDRLATGLSLVLYALPAFWLAVLALEIFAVQLDLFPAGQMRRIGAERLPPGPRLADLLHHLALPAAVLALSGAGLVLRFVRDGMRRVLEADHVRAARARGLGPLRVLLRHALPSTLGPVIHHFGVLLPMLLSGSLVVEVVFAWPGLGRVAYVAILERDMPVILAGTLVSGVLVVVGNLVADLAHAWIDPRVRRG